MSNRLKHFFVSSLTKFFTLYLVILSLLTIQDDAKKVYALTLKPVDGNIGYEFGNLPLEAQQALINAIQTSLPTLFPDGTYFVVGHYESYESWGIGYIAAAENNIPPIWEKGIWFIVQGEPILEVALQGTSLFDKELSNLPESLRPQIRNLHEVQVQNLPATFQFPWDRTQKWKYTTGWHGTTNLALDFAPFNVSPANMWILASADGTITEGCGDTYQSHIVLSTASGATYYGHVDYNSFHAQNIIGLPVVKAQKLAVAYNGSQGQGYYDTSKAWPWPTCTAGSSSSCSFFKFNTTCGAGTGAHVHWTLPSQSFLVDGWQIDSSGIWTRNGQPSRGVGSYFTSTSIVNSILPTSRTPIVGNSVTIFNTVVNAGSDTAYGVTLSMVSPPAGNFTYNRTDCATNAILGGANPIIDIDPQEAACYVLSFTPSAPFSATQVHIRAQASNASTTTLLTGINTWLLRSTSSAGPDIIALTTTTDFHQVACSGTNAFAVAMSNVGAAATGDITVAANTGSASLPISISIQETNPGTGVAIGDNILNNLGAGENRTVVVFVSFNGCVNFDPAANRIFIEFRDASNNVVGSTSTAISTNR